MPLHSYFVFYVHSLGGLKSIANSNQQLDIFTRNRSQPAQLVKAKTVYPRAPRTVPQWRFESRSPQRVDRVLSPYTATRRAA
eukprot:scaffold90156_cov20-Prasinocladus_malaysianus.AAC.1